MEAAAAPKKEPDYTNAFGFKLASQYFGACFLGELECEMKFTYHLVEI